MVTRIKLTRTLWLLCAVVAFFASVAGLVYPDMYKPWVSQTVLPGMVSQDLTTLIVAVALFILAMRLKASSNKIPIWVLGMLAYLFYTYGIYSIERVYTVFYFLYLAIFGLSFYSIVYTIANLSKEGLRSIQQKRLPRDMAIIFMLLNPLLFYPLWTVQILSIITSGQQLQNTYSIYILDMAIVLPAMIIIAAMAAKNKGLGLFLAPAKLINGFILLFSVALGALFRPFFQLEFILSEIFLYLILSLVFLLITVLYLRSMRFNKNF